MLVRKRWRYTDTPTSDAAHAFPGRGEVHGVVEALAPPIHARSDGEECVWWRYRVERQNRDSKGNTSWTTEEEGSAHIPFAVRDLSGTVRVVLDGSFSVSNTGDEDVDVYSLADLRAVATTHNKLYEPGAIAQALGSIFGSNDVHEAINDFSGTWRATEWRLPVGSMVFVAGTARLIDDATAVEFAGRDNTGDSTPLEITVGDQNSAMAANASRWMIFALSLTAVGTAVAFGAQAAGRIGATVAGAVGALVAGANWSIGSFNRMRRCRNRCDFAMSLIDVACEQRTTTIGQLDATVKAALVHERTTLEQLATDRGPASVQVSAELLARLEASPQLNTQPNVAHFVEQLRLLNDRVAFARRFHNDSLQQFQDRLGQFPDKLLARGVTGPSTKPW